MSGEKLRMEKRLLKLETDHYDFVVLDIMMPKWMDFQFVKKLENVRCADYIFNGKR